MLATHDADTPLIGASTQKLLVAAAALSILGPDSTLRDASRGAGCARRRHRRPAVARRRRRPRARHRRLRRASCRRNPRPRATSPPASRRWPTRSSAKGVHAHPRRHRRRRLPLRPAALPARRGRTPTAPTARSARSARSPSTTGSARGRRRARSPVDDPARERRARAHAICCAARGVQVGRHPGTGAAPGRRHRDRGGHVAGRCGTSSRSMLSSSDNLTAEMLTKELGVQASQQGTTAAGIAAITAKLKELGVPLADGALKDGSGPRPRQPGHVRAPSSPRSTSRERPEFATLYDGLPVAGRNGTLVDQLPRHPARGQVPGQDRIARRRDRAHRRRRPRTARPVRVPRQRRLHRDAGRGDPREGIGDIIGRYPGLAPGRCSRARAAVGFGSRGTHHPVVDPGDLAVICRDAADDPTRVAVDASESAAPTKRPPPLPQLVTELRDLVVTLLPAADPRPAPEARPLHRLRARSGRCCSASASCSSPCRACERCRTRPATPSPATGRGCRT